MSDAKTKLKSTLFPPLLVSGVHRYKQVAGSVYVRYNEHTKKITGLSQNVGGKMISCGLDVLIAQVNASERKKR